jgi:hypothetical protein
MVRLIETTRSVCRSAAIILFSSPGVGGSSSRDPPYRKTIGKGGRNSRLFETGDPYVKCNRKDSSMIRRHL